MQCAVTVMCATGVYHSVCSVETVPSNTELYVLAIVYAVETQFEKCSFGLYRALAHTFARGIEYVP